MNNNRLPKRLPDENSEHAFHELESVRDLRPAGRRSSTRKHRRIDTPTLLNAMDGSKRRHTGKDPAALRTGGPDLPHDSRSRVREDLKAAAVAASQRRLPWYQNSTLLLLLGLAGVLTAGLVALLFGSLVR